MKNKVVATLATGLSILALSASSAFAWTYGLSGSGQCQPDGSFKITWTVDNSSENQDLTVKSSSNQAVVANGTTVAAGQSSSFYETESGTSAPATYNLTLNVTWPGDQNDHIQTKSVTLDQACTQPTPPPNNPPSTPPQNPPTGGRGGGFTTTAQVTTTPSGSVNAGEGGASKGTNKFAVLGLLGSASIAGAGLGLKRLSKNGA